MQQAEDYKLRFDGTRRLYGAKYDLLAKSRVALIGLGGVGSWSCEALARSGIGFISLYDLDDICISNVNRQLPALTQTVGKPKIKVLSERIKQINPNCQVEEHLMWVLPNKIEELFTDKFDFIIDACDSLKTKVALSAWCKRNKIGFISCGSAGGKTDATKIKVLDLADAIQDPLLARLRAKLRKEHNFAKGGKKMGVKVVSSDQAIIKPEDCQTGGAKLDCGGGLGSFLPVTGTFGFVAAGFAIDYLLKNLGK